MTTYDAWKATDDAAKGGTAMWRWLALALVLVTTGIAGAQSYNIVPSRPSGSPYAPGTPQNPLTVYRDGWPLGQLAAPRPSIVGAPGTLRNPYLVYPLQPRDPSSWVEDDK